MESEGASEAIGGAHTRGEGVGGQGVIGPEGRFDGAVGGAGLVRSTAESKGGGEAQSGRGRGLEGVLEPGAIAEITGVIGDAGAGGCGA